MFECVVERNQLFGRYGRGHVEFFKIDTVPVAAAFSAALCRSAFNQNTRMDSAAAAKKCPRPFHFSESPGPTSRT